MIDHEVLAGSMTTKIANRWRDKIRRSRSTAAESKDNASAEAVEAAILNLEKAGRGTTDRSEPLRMAARLLVQVESWNEAGILAERAIRLAPFIRWEDLNLLADTLDHTGNVQLAAEIKSRLPEYKQRDRTARESVDELQPLLLS